MAQVHLMLSPYANGAWRTLADAAMRHGGAWQLLDKIWVARNVLTQVDPPIWETEWHPLATLRTPAPTEYVNNPSASRQGLFDQEVRADWTAAIEGDPRYDYNVIAYFFSDAGVLQFSDSAPQTAGTTGWHPWSVGGQCEVRIAYITTGGEGPLTSVWSN
jgi:hypothetical protein